MRSDEAVLIEVERPAALGRALEWARGAGCGGGRALDDRRAILYCDNALGAANRLAWAPGVARAAYGEFVGPGDLRDISRAMARLISRSLTGGERIWIHVEGGGDEAAFEDYLVGEIVSSTSAALDPRRPDRLFEVILAGGGAFLAHGYRRGMGGLPAGSEGTAIALFSGGRCGAQALVESFRAGFQARPLFLELGGATPPEGVRRALMAAAILVSNIVPSGGRVLAGYVPRRAAEALRGGGWLLHRFLAEVAARAARASGDRAVFAGISPEPGYAEVLRAYWEAGSALGVAFVLPQCCDAPRMPADEELESILEGHEGWSSGDLGPAREGEWSSGDLPTIAARVADGLVELRAEGEMARHEVLDGYLRERARLEELLEGGDS